MRITSAEFAISSSAVEFCPKEALPEYAFIGRSNVGKSSLINMLVDNKKMSRTSNTPGKTQLINHFIINKSWFLVDLPGYGYAKVSKAARRNFEKMIGDYLQTRPQLINTFVLIDIRHKPQQIDLDFMQRMGMSGLAFSIIFTKSDKLGIEKSEIKSKEYLKEMTDLNWEDPPPHFISSAIDGTGRKDILNYINDINKTIDITQISHQLPDDRRHWEGECSAT